MDSKVDSKDIKIKEYEKIMEMSNDELVEEFENDIRKSDMDEKRDIKKNEIIIQKIHNNS